MIKAAVVGATGYAGAELVRILHGHPRVELVALTTQSYAGKPFGEVFPHLYGFVQMDCRELDLAFLDSDVDVIFTALPHGHSMPVVAEAVRRGWRCIDLGADFRFRDPLVYEAWYKVEHTCRELLAEAVYGLPELNRERIRDARVVGNPGCYPTGAILGLAPAVEKGLLDPDTIVIDSKSGVSGAGRALSLGTHYSEVNENMRAYNVGVHRHTPEIEQELSGLAGTQIRVSFTPHLTPMTRGILSTIYARLTVPLSQAEVWEIYSEFYRSEPFVRVLPEGMLPQTKAVMGSNLCDVTPVVDSRTGRLIVITAIDNLVKGAAGQAVQNMNIMFGLPETAGLDRPGLYP